MNHHGHPTAKPSVVWSTSWPISLFNRGSLSRKTYQKAYDTTIRYEDGSGRRRFKGSANLKKTQPLRRSKFWSSLALHVYFEIKTGYNPPWLGSSHAQGLYTAVCLHDSPHSRRSSPSCSQRSCCCLVVGLGICWPSKLDSGLEGNFNLLFSSVAISGWHGYPIDGIVCWSFLRWFMGWCFSQGLHILCQG